MSVAASIGRVVSFTRGGAPGTCTSCGGSVATHWRVGSRWVGCSRDVVVGRDQFTPARRLRLALLQSRRTRVQPFGIGPGAEHRE